MKLSLHFHVFLRKTLVQTEVVLSKLDFFASLGTTWVLVCEFPIPLLMSTASSYEGGTISFHDDFDGVLTSKWWISPSWSLQPVLKAVLLAECSAAITASSQIVFSTNLSWRELHAAKKSETTIHQQLQPQHQPPCSFLTKQCYPPVLKRAQLWLK